MKLMLSKNELKQKRSNKKNVPRTTADSGQLQLPPDAADCWVDCSAGVVLLGVGLALALALALALRKNCMRGIRSTSTERCSTFAGNNLRQEKRRVIINLGHILRQVLHIYGQNFLLLSIFSDAIPLVIHYVRTTVV